MSKATDINTLRVYSYSINWYTFVIFLLRQTYERCFFKSGHVIRLLSGVE